MATSSDPYFQNIDLNVHGVDSVQDSQVEGCCFANRLERVIMRLFELFDMYAIEPPGFTAIQK